ncbi:hypothetical protein DPMN_099494 [Dreissena polymorpha]|uniref:Uncharacterized protein n=1 Tax=Dreissena polymorpha TaxID=45954 RepID=A0A9D4LFL6_DREPO|nr:hypothetical protein DPMN_099494 [Dreissena polymorpha]
MADHMASAILWSSSSDNTGHDMTGTYPRTLITDLWLCIDRRLTGRSGHRPGLVTVYSRSGQRSSPVRSPFITGMVTGHHLSPCIGPVIGQKKKSFIIIGLFFFFFVEGLIVNELSP